MFETERLFLRAIDNTDAGFMLELLNSPKWIQNIGDRKVYTVADALSYIDTKITPQFNRLGFSNYVLIKKNDKSKIGVCGLFDRIGVEGIDLGFALLPAFEKHGYAYEAAEKIMDLACNHFNIELLRAITTFENLDSQKLLTKLRFQFEKMIFLPNDDTPLMQFIFKT
jgi:RimJ/RimL family protein N-acetyltransferase